MRVKVNGQWFTADDGGVVVEITSQDFKNITSIYRAEGDERPRRYGVFPDEMSVGEMRAIIEYPGAEGA